MLFNKINYFIRIEIPNNFIFIFLYFIRSIFKSYKYSSYTQNLRIDLIDKWGFDIIAIYRKMIGAKKNININGDPLNKKYGFNFQLYFIHVLKKNNWIMVDVPNVWVYYKVEKHYQWND